MPAFGKSIIFFTPCAECVINHKMMDKTANIGNGNAFKRIYDFEPIAIEIENFFIKSGIIRKSTFNFIVAEIAEHLLCHITELFHADGSRSQSADIKRTLVCVVCRIEKRKIMPNLLNDKITLYKTSAGFCVKNQIADIIAKHLVFFNSCCLSIKHTNFHFFYLNF